MEDEQMLRVHQQTFHHVIKGAVYVTVGIVIVLLLMLAFLV